MSEETQSEETERAVATQGDRIFVLAPELLEAIKEAPRKYPGKTRLRDFLVSAFPDAGFGFANDLPGLAKDGFPVTKAFLTHLVRFWRARHPEMLEEAFDADSTELPLDELVGRCIALDSGETPKQERRRDLIEGGPTVAIGELLQPDFEIDASAAGPLVMQDLKDAALTGVGAVGDAYCEDPDYPPFDESVERGLSALALSFEEVVDMIRTFREFHPHSVYFRRGATPAHHQMTMVLPLTEESQEGFISGELDEWGVTYQPKIKFSPRVLILWQAGGLRRSARAQVNLMKMMNNQLQHIRSPVLQEPTELVAYLHPGKLGRTARNWGFKDTGGCLERQPVIKTGYMKLPRIPPAASLRMNLLWGIFFVWDSYHGRVKPSK